MISANGGLPAHRYTPQVTQRWPRGSEPASIEHGWKRSRAHWMQFYNLHIFYSYLFFNKPCSFRLPRLPYASLRVILVEPSHCVCITLLASASFPYPLPEQVLFGATAVKSLKDLFEKNQHARTLVRVKCSFYIHDIIESFAMRCAACEAARPRLEDNNLTYKLFPKYKLM